jgi:uncharacterized 2Fe-2S/4Fe-4S cluster protein (DUF4445 family)
MSKITFLPSGKTIDAPAGSELIDIAKLLDINLTAPCGGKGTCGKCIVKITSGSVETDSLGALSKEEVENGYVLACRTKIALTPVTIEIPEQTGLSGGKFIENMEDSFLIKSEILPKNINIKPQTSKLVVNVTAPVFGDGLSDYDRLIIAVQKISGQKNINIPLTVIQKIPDTVRNENGKITITLSQNGDGVTIIDIESGEMTGNHYGIAVDIGTTTVACELIDLTNGKTLGIFTDYNSQIECGLDVISRINYARKPARLAELKNKILKTIHILLEKVSEKNKITPEDIVETVISGNTTMIHLLLGINPEYIRLEPYVPVLFTVPELIAKDAGINVNPESPVYISPAVGSYVGGDITAGLLCSELSHNTEDINVFIDIGTNGEIVAGNKDFLLTCACSAGPAFEGGGIEYGMRASTGAIEKVEIDIATGKPSLQVIGNVKPKGICGSGMISLLANLFLTGWIDARGKFERNKKSDFIKIDGRRAYYILAGKEISDNGKEIIITELDIDNIIRAKGAIYSACSLLVKQMEISFEDISHFYIAGGFGKYLNIENAIVLGMIPDISLEKYLYIGNSSLLGSYMVLISEDFKKLQIETAKKMTYIDLGSMPDYMDHYSASMFLPHTDINLFPSVKKHIDK